MIALARSRQRADLVQRGQDTLFVALRLAGWGATTLLAALGTGLLVFVALGSFTFAGLMLQLGNLASRFAAAGPARQSEFEALVLAIFATVVALTAFFRRASLRAALTVSIGVQSGPPIGAQKGPPLRCEGRLILGAGFALLAA